MGGAVRGVLPRSAHYVQERVRRWRTGSRESQNYVLSLLLIGVAVSFVVSWNAYRWMPLTAYFVWLLAGMLVLRFKPLALLTVVASVAAVVAMRHDGPIDGARLTALLTLLLSVALILYQSSRQRSGLPVTLSEAMLAELRDRLQAQGVMPALPTAGRPSRRCSPPTASATPATSSWPTWSMTSGWRWCWSTCVGRAWRWGRSRSSSPARSAGCSGRCRRASSSTPPTSSCCGSSRTSPSRPPYTWSSTCEDGRYTITSAGHPPALRWEPEPGEWVVDNARGMALGIMVDPELHQSEGVLPPGGALLFYTDGVVESRTTDLDIGIAWLQRAARDAVARGFPGAARRIIRQVRRGDDDRAVLILNREDESAGAPL